MPCRLNTARLGLHLIESGCHGRAKSSDKDHLRNRSGLHIKQNLVTQIKQNLNCSYCCREELVQYRERMVAFFQILIERQRTRSASDGCQLK